MSSTTGSTGSNVSNGTGSTLGSAPVTANQGGGRRHRGASVKTLKRILKKNGLKTTGKKATLTRRAKKAHLKMKGGDDLNGTPTMGGEYEGGKKKRSRRSRGIFGKLF